MVRVRSIRVWAVHVVALVALAMFSGACTEKSVDRILADAKQERDKGNFRSALIELKTLLQRDPENAEARYLLGVTYNDIDDFQAAEIELRRAIDQGHEQAKVMIGRPLLMLGQFQKVLDQVPLDDAADKAVQADVLTLRARALLGLGRRPEARELLDQALAKQPEFAEALLTLAHLAAWEGKPGDTEKLIDRALASAPKSAEGWLMKGDLARYKSDPAGASEAYQKVLGFSPENISARLSLVSLHIAASNFEDAEKQLAVVRKLAPKLLVARYITALIEFRQKKYTAARDSVLQVLKVTPYHLPSLLLAGRIEYVLGQHAQAQKYLAMVIERAPGYLYARKLLISSLAKTGHLQRAIEMLQPGLQQAPEDGTLIMLAGEIYLRGNEFARAAQYFEQAVKLGPNSARARAGLGVSRLALGETDRALADLESAAEIDTEKYQADVLTVVSHLQRQNYDQALEAMKSLEKKQPKNPLTYNLKALIYSGKKDTATARKHFEHALELDPLYFAAAMNLAQLDLQDKKPADARRRFETILEKDKNNAQALLGLADIAPHINATSKELIDWLERARNASPGSPQPMLRLAQAYSQSGDPKKAMEIAQQTAAAHPDNPGVLYGLGAIQMGAGAKEQALVTYNRLVALQPKSATALVRLALVQAASGDSERAASTLRKAISLQPDFVDAYVALASLELKAKRYPAAIKIAQQVQKQSPKSAAGFVIEGDILMAEKKFPQASRAYETAYSMGKNGVVLIKLHAASTRAGKAEEADARLAQWLKDSPDDATVRYYAAEAKLKSGEFKDAIEHYEWVLKSQPDNVAALNNLATAYGQVKDTRALETAERAHKLQPDNAAVADTLGWILVEQGNTNRGLEILKKAVTAAPTATEPRYHLALAFVKVGDRASARKELEKLLADAPDSRFANDAKKQLLGLSH